MIEFVQAFDGAPITTLNSNDAAALEKKINAAQSLFAERGAWLKTTSRLRSCGSWLRCWGKREHLGRQGLVRASMDDPVEAVRWAQ
jgi:hypothetical protein